MKKLLSLFALILIFSCQKEKQQVDTLVINANVYTVNSNFDKAEAFAIKDGKFFQVGTSKDLQNTFEADTIIDAKGRAVFPGFIDAHCHFYGLGMNLQKVDLRGTTSFDEVMKRVLDYQNERQTDFIIGRGWDQNDWEDKKFPNKKLLDALFPDTPVALTRIDGHAMLCNQAALDLANITKETKMDGGEIIIEDGELTGVLIDNPMELVEAIFPKPNRELQINALLDAQNICTNLGLTTVSDAGLHREVIELMDSLQQTGDLHMRVYAMVSNTKDNLDYYLTKGKIKTDQLNVQSVKVYADGALGSRGAALKAPYSDKEHHFGAMVIGLEDFKALASRIEAANYQMNTHAIGDSANRFVLKTYEKTLQGETDRRWRVEHAQIITDNDFELFKNENIIPSIQPTHATSDMYWAEDRLGAERIKGAYAYKTLLNASGKVALGTDFPVEQVSPFLTFYAAVSRQDVKGYPEGGFNLQDGLSREETLKGMTIWAAYANFEEDEKGSIEVEKFADFIILDQDIMTTDVKNIPNIKVEQTYIGGVKQ
ncbi:MAG: amidohydrolase [Xanthomarina sp.]|uniref:amidohydrolase n=1 Tax=Xanthomarina sp. TaxID=1931211 RepID=UPI000C4AAA4F|nr:amidohydrolase [Xanthomarina sp.]MAL23744.1 amidohydrolase [Xanthomarina sp.]MBF62251.1 amidohydrolase [Xanthomarina sp.]HAI19085.1 amidohydrolase [Xanthomarina gelatinilytica]